MYSAYIPPVNICVHICKWPWVIYKEVYTYTVKGCVLFPVVSMTELKDVFLWVTLRPQTAARHVLMPVLKKQKKHIYQLTEVCWHSSWDVFFSFFLFMSEYMLNNEPGGHQCTLSSEDASLFHMEGLSDFTHIDGCRSIVPSQCLDKTQAKKY